MKKLPFAVSASTRAFSAGAVGPGRLAHDLADATQVDLVLDQLEDEAGHLRRQPIPRREEVEQLAARGVEPGRRIDAGEVGEQPLQVVRRQARQRIGNRIAAARPLLERPEDFDDLLAADAEDALDEVIRRGGQERVLELRLRRRAPRNLHALVGQLEQRQAEHLALRLARDDHAVAALRGEPDRRGEAQLQLEPDVALQFAELGLPHPAEVVAERRRQGDRDRAVDLDRQPGAGVQIGRGRDQAGRPPRAGGAAQDGGGGVAALEPVDDGVEAFPGALDAERHGAARAQAPSPPWRIP